MANKLDVRGMSIRDILNIPYEEWNKLSSSDLKVLTQRLNSAANKRLKRLSSSRAGKYSPALQSRREGRKKTGQVKKFSTKLPKNLKGDQVAGKIKSAFSDVKNFLNTKTSTAKGAEKFKEHLLERFPNLVNKTGEISEYKMKRVWKAYHAVGEMKGISGALGQVLDSREFQNAIAQAVQDGTYRKAGMDLKTFAGKVFDEMAEHPERSREEIFRKLERGIDYDEEEREGEDEEGFILDGETDF